MKLLLDQNISYRVVKLIADHFPESTGIKNCNLTNANDFEIWKFAKENGYTIVTFDEDFCNIQLLKGYPPKIVWFKTGNLSNKQVADYLITHKEMICLFANNSAYEREGCLELFILNPKP